MEQVDFRHDMTTYGVRELAVAFLFSDDAARVSGQIWSICGGMSLRD
jgi:hypothetical protein